MPLWCWRALVPAIQSAAFELGPGPFFSDPQVLALVEAVDREDLPEIDRLVAAGVDVNADGPHFKAPDRLHMTPLLWAINHKEKAAFKRLLEHGADPSQTVVGFGRCSVMVHAAVDDDPDWLRMILERRRYSRMPTTPWGTTALENAILARRLDNVKLLTQEGADINHRSGAGGTPAMAAASSSSFEGAYYLIEAGTTIARRQFLAATIWRFT